METKKQLTFGDVENDSPFMIGRETTLWKMGRYGFGVDTNGTVAVKFHNKDIVSHKKHLYSGFADSNDLCVECGKTPRDSIHYFNAGTACDTLDGACACGAWHKPETILISKNKKQNGEKENKRG